MTQKLLVVKMGGSIISDKSKPLTAQPQVIKELTKELQEIYQRYPDYSILLGTGGGSFAHFSAHEYQLVAQGARNLRRLFGMCLTHTTVQQLNAMVAQALIDHAVPVFSLSPAALFTTAQGEIASRHLAPMELLLANRCIPIVHGDTIIDSKKGTTIFSTERALYESVRHLRSQFQEIVVVYLQSANGLLDDQGRTIALLQPEDSITVQSFHAHDISHGVTGKVTAARQMAQLVNTVFVAGGGRAGALTQIISGHHAGTRVI